MRYLSFFLLFASCINPKPEPSSLRAVAPIAAPATSPGAAFSAPTSRALSSSVPLKAGKYCASIVSVIEAEIYRGTPPKSQSQLDAEKAGKAYEEDDHFMRYLKCEYEVAIKGARYTFNDYVSDITLQDELEISMCESRREEVEQQIESFTKRCTKVRGSSEYYGYLLTPIK
jgi:hypothetical protein